MCSNCSGDYEDPEVTSGDAVLEPIEEADRPVAWPSPLLYHRKPLDVSFDELETP